MKALLGSIAAAAAFAAPVLACGDPEWHGDNLVITPRVKASLRVAYLAAHPRLRASQVGGPVSGRTYYGRYSGTRYAVATFRPGYSAVFRTDVHGRWHVRGESRGAVCTTVIPYDLIAVWWLQRVGEDCYAIPA